MIEITSSRILDYVNEAETKIICHNKKRINLEDSFHEKAHYVCYRIRGTLQFLDEIRFLKKYK